MNIKKRVIATVAACTVLCGCVNLLGTRNPFNERMKIKECYEATRIAAGSAIIVAYPQMMSNCPSDYGFKPFNCLTIPLSALVFVDAVCEIPIDTVCVPYDWFAGRAVNVEKEAK